MYTFKVVLTPRRRVFSRYCVLVRRPKFEPAASRTINNSNILFPRTLWSLLLWQIFFNRRNSIPRITDYFSIFAILSQYVRATSSHPISPWSSLMLRSHLLLFLHILRLSFLCLSYRLCGCSTSMPPLPRHPPWFGHPSYIWWRVQIMNVSNLLFRRPTKRSLKVLQSVRFPQWRRVSFTLIQHKYSYGLVHLHIYTSVYRQKDKTLYELWTKRLESFPKSLRHTNTITVRTTYIVWWLNRNPKCCCEL